MVWSPQFAQWNYISASSIFYFLCFSLVKTCSSFRFLAAPVFSSESNDKTNDVWGIFSLLFKSWKKHNKKCKCKWMWLNSSHQTIVPPVWGHAVNCSSSVRFSTDHIGPTDTEGKWNIKKKNCATVPLLELFTNNLSQIVPCTGMIILQLKYTVHSTTRARDYSHAPLNDLFIWSTTAWRLSHKISWTGKIIQTRVLYSVTLRL